MAQLELRRGLLDKLQQLEIEAYEMKDPETGEAFFAIRGPTWCVNPKTSLSSFKADFISDEPGALRDYAALPQFALTPFFTDPEVLDRMAGPADELPIDRETLMIKPWFKPRLGFNYFFAGDLSVSGDNTGLSMAHYDWMINNIVLDFSFEKSAERGTRIDYEPIRQLIYNLRDRGFNIKKALFDQFQSNDSINQIIRHGIQAEQVNYAESFVGCIQLHELIHTGRLVYQKCFTEFIGEAKELQIVNSKRVDHLKSGGKYNGKDAWDSAVNAVLGAIEDYNKFGSLAENNKTVAATADKLLLKTGSAIPDPHDISWIL